MKHIHVDMEQIEAMIAEGNKVLAAEAENEGIKGVFARLGISIGSAFSRQLAIEINRGTSPRDLQQAFAMVVANLVSDLAGSCARSNDDPLAKADGLLTLKLIAHFLMSRESGTILHSGEVLPSSAGTA